MCWLASWADIMGMSDQEIADLLHRYVTVENCGRTPEGNDVVNAIAWGTGRKANVTGRGVGAQGPKYPQPDPAETDRVVQAMDGYFLQNINHEGGNVADEYKGNAYGILERLYHRTALVCTGRDFYTPITRSLTMMRGIDLTRMEFIVPNPMSKRSGKTQQDKDYPRCRDAAAKEWRYQVIECDITRTDEAGNPTIWASWLDRWERQGLTVYDVQARVIRWLAEHSPFTPVMVVHSGGKSLHAWFDVRNASDSDLQKFRSDAAKLGADQRLYLPEQWSRFPNGTRSDGRRQPVLYFNPELSRDTKKPRGVLEA